ncbi:SDR family NAD(P)-dependent oxidoreductase [Geothrix sp. PMB-07]|uniref:SDR family NAD(P)-dependent oxidoreductase n=1 Tax=Geothrix sp. PMB-07 TaxID=3068640 RepID=UPI0027426FF5|nr:SDR family oxidoreductase [Geothrix sp. PMB-07]WLT31616.1 SDR family oxidoreductase [Geothrix sp. PMB-07]
MALSPALSDLLSLEGQVALVTGAASGIGRGTALRLAEAGAAVLVLDINEAGGQETARLIEAAGGRAAFQRCDVRQEADCKAAAEAAMARFGRIDILFNNAGIAIRKNALDLLESEWDLALGVMLKGVYLLTRQVVPFMIQGGRGGSIINTGSGWALKGGPDALSYCAAKGGVWNMTRAMAIDFGRHRIRVNAVCPGDIDTPMLRSECAQLGGDEARFMEEAAARPLHRVGTPQDVANTVLFLASGLSAWVTGTHVVVDGGGIA